MTNDSLYLELAAQKPTGAEVGGALITLVEPHRGFAREYNRWYEDDHFYAGAMSGPWFISGRRWVATRKLKDVRFGAAEVFPSLQTGSYFATYLVSEGHLADARTWGTNKMGSNLIPDGRGYAHRDHIFPAFSDFAFGTVRDEGSPLLARHAMDRNYAGMTLQVLDPGSGQRPNRLENLATFTRSFMQGSSIAQCLCLLPQPMDVSSQPDVVGLKRQGELICLLWFHETDPLVGWQAYVDAAPEIERASQCVVELTAPFFPTNPGTHDYADDLW